MSRIDRFLVSNDWESYFSGGIQSTLPKPISDHCPILLDAGGIRKGHIPFRFEVILSRPRYRSDPIGESEPVSGCETIYWDSFFFFF